MTRISHCEQTLVTEASSLAFSLGNEEVLYLHVCIVHADYTRK
jgi:hypothetical protein